MSTVEQVQQQIITATGANLLPETSLNDFQQKLACYLNELVNQHFEKLLTILYRLDVSEKKLKEALMSASLTDTGSIIAAMIIERQMQKIKTRNDFSKPNTDISDEERW